MNFEWDPGKARQCGRKHGGSFQEAATVFSDPLAVTFPDPDHSVSNSRFITIGMSRNSRILIVSHVDRGENIRIISSRKTTSQEQKYYEEEN